MHARHDTDNNPQGIAENEQSSIALATDTDNNPQEITESEQPRIALVSINKKLGEDQGLQQTHVYFHHALDMISSISPNSEMNPPDIYNLRLRVALAIKAMKQSTSADTYFYVTHVSMDLESTYLIHGLECETYAGINAQAQQYKVSLPESATDNNDGVTFDEVKNDKLPPSFQQNNIGSYFSEGKIIITPPSPPTVQPVEKFTIDRHYDHDEAGLLFKDLQPFIDKLVARKKEIDSTNENLIKQEKKIASLKTKWLGICKENPNLSKDDIEQCNARQEAIQANLDILIKEKNVINAFLVPTKAHESNEEDDSFVDLGKSFAELYIEFKNSQETLAYKKRFIAWALQKTAADHFLNLQNSSLNDSVLRKKEIEEFEEKFKDIIKLENGNLIYCENFVEEFASYTLNEISDKISALYDNKQDFLFKTLNDISQSTGLTLSTSLTWSLQTTVHATFDQQTKQQEETIAEKLAQMDAPLAKEINATKIAACTTNLEQMIAQTTEANTIVIEKIKLNINIEKLRKLKQSIEETKNSITSLREAMQDTQHIAISTPPTLVEAFNDPYEEVIKEIEELKSFHARLKDELVKLQEHSRQHKLRLAGLKNLLIDIIANTKAAYDLQIDVEKNLTTPEECRDWNNYASKIDCVLAASMEIEKNNQKYSSLEAINNDILIYTSIKEEIQQSLQAVREALASKKEEQINAKSDDLASNNNDGTSSPLSRSQSFDDYSENDDTPPPSQSLDDEKIKLENPKKAIQPKPRSNKGTIIAELSGGITGALFGAGIGALIGFLLVPITFGVSIPVFAAIGAAVGGAVGGLLIGGAAGTVVGNLYDKRVNESDDPDPEKDNKYWGEYPAAIVAVPKKRSSTAEILKDAPKGKKKNYSPIVDNPIAGNMTRSDNNGSMQAAPNQEPATPKGRRGSMRISN